PKIFAKTNIHGAPPVGMLCLVAGDLLLILTGLVNTSGLITMLLAGSCFWIASYIITHINVLALRRRYPETDRNKKLMFWGIPQILGMIGSVFMVWNIAEGDARILIYKIFFVMFVILAVFAAMWSKFVLKKPLFAPAPMDEVLALESPETLSQPAVRPELAVKQSH
ncbi:MAG: APC family permease, partial [Gracilibacteraceae bacterium]|nr:APC family permease [Gracilibacteraceae bacterium]